MHNPAQSPILTLPVLDVFGPLHVSVRLGCASEPGVPEVDEDEAVLTEFEQDIAWVPSEPNEAMAAMSELLSGAGRRSSWRRPRFPRTDGKSISIHAFLRPRFGYIVSVQTFWISQLGNHQKLGQGGARLGFVILWEEDVFNGHGDMLYVPRAHLQMYEFTRNKNVHWPTGRDALTRVAFGWRANF